jgi:hypothetical protein
MIERCDGVRVLTLDGWLGSVGVTTEMGLAVALGKPVEYVEP